MAQAAPRPNLTLGLGLGALLFFVLGWVFASGEENGWIWLVMGALSLAAVISGVMAKRAGRLDKMAMGGLVVGALLLLLFLLFVFGILE